MEGWGCERRGRPQRILGLDWPENISEEGETFSPFLYDSPLTTGSYIINSNVECRSRKKEMEEVRGGGL